MPTDLTEIDGQSQHLVNLLVNEVTKAGNSADVSPITRAWLAIELVKDAVDDDKIKPIDAWEFAESLQNFNGVPVTIGNEEVKIFPAYSIIRARPKIIEITKKAAETEGIQFDELNTSTKKIGLRVIEKFKSLSLQAIYQYFPFQLSPKDGVSQVLSQAKKDSAVREMLFGELNELSPNKEEALEIFFRVNFPNIIIGDLLKDWLTQNYGIKAKN